MKHYEVNTILKSLYNGNSLEEAEAIFTMNRTSYGYIELMEVVENPHRVAKSLKIFSK